MRRSARGDNRADFPLPSSFRTFTLGAALLGTPAATAALHAGEAAHPDHGDIIPFCLVGDGTEGGGGGPLPIAVMIDEVEPNDSFGTPQIVGANLNERTAVEGSINSAGDVDFYSIALQQGDVVQFYVEALSLEHSVELKLHDALGDPMVTTRTAILAAPIFIAPNAPFITSPGGDAQDQSAALTWVVQETRDVVIRVATDAQFGASETGDYLLNITRVRAPIESAPPGTKLTIFLDFDGAMITQGDIYNPNPGPDPLSPLSAFLPNWGLSAGDEDAVIDAIVTQVEARIQSLAPLNPLFEYELTNSRDHPDTFGDPWVTRVIIGGTIAELGVSTIGIAESIDVGDFAPNQTAFVLLDILSSEGSGSSLNNIPRADGFTMIDAIGQALGIIVSHEFGHNLGGVHTENTNDVRSVMDAGGFNLPQNLFGVGEDGIFGTEDDDFVLFSLDAYIGSSPTGQLEGLEPTDFVAAIAFGAPTGCAADLTGDGEVNGADLASLLANWGTAAKGADFNGDGVIDGADLASLLSAWGPCEAVE